MAKYFIFVQMIMILFQHLKEHLENRAGTANRQYRMGAYKLDIRSEENEHLFNLWALAEGPTPLLTFYEAYNGGSAEAGINFNLHEC